MVREPFNPYLIAPPPPSPRMGGDLPLTVSQVTALVKHAIDEGLPSTMHVVGEISNFKRHSSGHLYLTLKDSGSELACVMWRGEAARLKFEPANGLEVIATGGIEVFERAGRYQLYIRRLEPRGVGALELAYRQLRDRLQVEGLFDPRHKKPLPPYPRRIAVVTSPTGAAVADIMHTITRRYPCVEVLLYPVRVQGPGAGDEVAAAIRRLDALSEALGLIDVMIVGRGGGSLEDLWAFNEEAVARAIFASRIPIVSAVGHETDYTIADLVADVRAATPTAAAELVVPVLADLLSGLARRESRMARATGGRLSLAASKLAGVVQRRWFREPLVKVQRREQIVDELLGRMERTARDALRRQRLRIDAIAPLLQRIAPHAYVLRTSARVQGVAHRLDRALERRAVRASAAFADLVRRMEVVAPQRTVAGLVERVGGLERRVAESARRRVELLVAAVASREELLHALSYRSVLGRGFSITRRKKGGDVVRSPQQVNDGDRVFTETADGTFESQVVNRRQGELFE